MDAIIHNLLSYVNQHQAMSAAVASFVIGVVIPYIIGMALPRRKTIQYGMAINRWVGRIFLQKRATNLPIVSDNAWSKLGHAIRTTFVDLSFGVYLDSRKDFTQEQVNQKINEYLALKPEQEIAND